jgi:hypothetical protein
MHGGKLFTEGNGGSGKRRTGGCRSMLIRSDVGFKVGPFSIHSLRSPEIMSEAIRAS